MIERWKERNTDPLHGIWAVEEKATRCGGGDRAARTAAFAEPPDESKGEVEVGWHFHPDAWGRGLATESAKAAIRHGFTAGLGEIYAVVRPDNHPSLAVCRRLGMRSLGLTGRWYGAELESFVI